MQKNWLVSSVALTERLFQFSKDARQTRRHQKFVSEMVVGILGAKSTVVSNVARFLNEKCSLQVTENRLCKMLSNDRLPWDELRDRITELGSLQVGQDDVIAFDPGEIIKEYAWKMENIYRVHDGSRDECGNGFEDFSVEAVQWRDGKKMHIPLYQKLISARCEDYISQNAQICEAIYAVHGHLGDNRGVWTFDRGHDRSRIFSKALLPLADRMRWIVRAKENRSVIPENPRYLMPRKFYPGLMDVVKQIPLRESPMRLTFPKTTGKIHLGWERVRLVISDHCDERWLSLVIAHDRRNKDPVVLLTNQFVGSPEDAIQVFGYYLERWGKEEGYRFSKSFLNTENIRTLNWEATQNLAFLAFLAYVLVTLFHRADPEQIEREAERRLKHFRPIEELGYCYYRVAQLMRILLWEQRGMPADLMSMTEVG